MTQTRSKTAATLENALEEITSKLFALDEKVENLSEIIKRIEDRMQRHDEESDEFVQQSSVIHYQRMFGETNGNVHKGKAEFILENRNKVNTNNKMYKKKREMIGVWRKLLNERKQAYWNATRCENLADTYEKWRQKEQVTLPRKYRLKPINKEHEEPDEETKIRMNLAAQKLDAKITLLRVRVPKYKIKFENCDKQIFEEISRRTSEEITSNPQNLWNKVEIEANKSEEILKSEQKWLDDYKKNYGNDWMKTPQNRK
jgi:hypothetical protein